MRNVANDIYSKNYDLRPGNHIKHLPLILRNNDTLRARHCFQRRILGWVVHECFKKVEVDFRTVLISLFKQDGCPNSDEQSKGGSNLLGVHATVHKP